MRVSRLIIVIALVGFTVYLLLGGWTTIRLLYEVVVYEYLRLVPPPPGDIVEVRFYSGKHPYYDWQCTTTINDTHIATTCWNMRKPREIVFTNGVWGHDELRIRSIAFAGRTWIAWYNYTITAVMDLEDKWYTVVEEVNLSDLGLGVFRRVLENGTYTIKRIYWTNYLGPPLFNQLLVYDNQENTYKIIVAMYTYKEVSRGVWIAIPSTMERARNYTQATGAWCLAIKTMTGIDCKVEVVDAKRFCKERVRLGVTDLGFILKEKEPICREADVIAVVEVPGLISSGNIQAGGVFLPKLRTIMVFEHLRLYIIHEVGHALGLSDTYNKSMEGWPVWARILVMYSGMYKPPENLIKGTMRIGFIDAVHASILAVRKLPEDVREEVVKTLRSKGVEVTPRGYFYLLPVTEDGNIPAPLRWFIEDGLVIIQYSDKDIKIYVNQDLVKALQAIAKTAEKEKT